MATSGTYTWSLDVDGVINDAIDLVGGQPALGYDPRMARRCINLLQIEWENRGIPLFTIPVAPVELELTEGDATYALPTNYVDIIEGVMRTESQLDVDLGMQRLGLRDYLQIPNKDQEGRPTQYVTHRRNDRLYVTFWEVPNTDDTYTFLYYPFSKIEDVTKSYQDLAAPTRFLPAYSAGLAYYFSLRRPGVTRDKQLSLKSLYEEQLNWAFDEDRERVDMVVVPKVRRLGA